MFKVITIKKAVLYSILMMIIMFFCYFLVLARNGGDWATGAARVSPGYHSIIQDNVGLDARFVDIAMVAAHNTATSDISRWSSVDPNEDTIQTQFPALSAFARGVFNRLSRTQFSNVEGLFYAGVRYLDLRVTLVDGTWYMENTLLGLPLYNTIEHIMNVLDANPGEFLVLAFNDVRYADGGANEDVITYLQGLNLQGRNIFDYLHFDPSIIPMGELKLRDITVDGTKGGIVVTLPSNEDTTYFYNSRTSVRRSWRAINNTTERIAWINNEVNVVTSLISDPTSDVNNRLRINQAQLALALWGPGLVHTLLSWGYIRANVLHNGRIINYSNLANWLHALPVIQFGAVETTRNNFNSRIVAIINTHNYTYNR